MLHPEERAAWEAQRAKPAQAKPSPLEAELKEFRRLCPHILAFLSRDTEVEANLPAHSMSFQAGRRNVFLWLRGPEGDG